MVGGGPENGKQHEKYKKHEERSEIEIQGKYLMMTTYQVGKRDMAVSGEVTWNEDTGTGGGKGGPGRGGKGGHDKGPPYPFAPEVLQVHSLGLIRPPTHILTFRPLIW